MTTANSVPHAHKNVNNTNGLSQNYKWSIPLANGLSQKMLVVRGVYGLSPVSMHKWTNPKMIQDANKTESRIVKKYTLIIWQRIGKSLST